MVMAVALLLTQCRKPAVELPTAGPANENMVSMTVTVGHGRTLIGADGAITWSAGDKLYVGDGSKYIGFLTLVGDGGDATGTFSGSVSTTTSTTFGFYYLGSGDYTSSLESDPTKVDISFASQTGVLADASSCHIGYGTASGRVDGTSVILESTDPVTMKSKVAIAYFDFKENGTSDYPGAITLSGENICNEMTVKFSGAESGMFTGKTVGNISLASTPSSKKYVMLVPTGTGEETLEFGGGAEGSTTLYKGIEANKFYCVGAGEPIAVTVKPVEFTVNRDNDTKVTFAPGNLYYDGTTDNKWKFEANQYDFRTYKDKGSCINGTYNSDSGTPANDWGLFGWSGSSQTHYGKITSENNSDYSGTTLKDWGTAPGLPSAGEGRTWRTLTDDEWKNLLGINGAESPRDNAASLRAWVTLKITETVSVPGLVILPDGSTVAASTVTTTALVASSGAVFLPAAGYRDGTVVRGAGSDGFYWSGTPREDNEGSAYSMNFFPSGAHVNYDDRRYGSSVRLVR